MHILGTSQSNIYTEVLYTEKIINFIGGDIMAEKNGFDWIALVLVIVGGLNWGFVGLFQLDLVKTIFGSIPFLQNAVYVLVGLSAAYMIYFAMKK
jgi:uncharacterized protein